jgi:hypothetical protein
MWAKNFTRSLGLVKGEQADRRIAAADRRPLGAICNVPRYWGGLTEELLIRLLRDEPETVIPFAPIFPAEPFAR